MSAPTLDRQTFTLSRALEFFSERELTTQIGYGRDWWPIALAKELIDNALDACEAAGRPPEIAITLDPDALTVQDNGPGLPLATLERSLDYQVRVSDKLAYTSPTRGQQGNALKTVWAAPYVLDGHQGLVEVTTGGTTHQVHVALDRIAQEPAITLSQIPDGHVKTGTAITMHWPQIASYLDGDPRPSFYIRPPDLYVLLGGYSLFNPHAALRLQPAAGARFTALATDPTWLHWLPNSPTSPHWYTAELLRTLIAAYLAEERRGDRARTVREFIAEFAGLAGTAKQKTIAEAAGLTGAYLHDLVRGADVDLDQVQALLSAMQAAARVIPPQALGVLGQAHITRRLVDNYYCTAESITYRKAQGLIADKLPYVLEVAFGILRADMQQCGRTVAVGLNWAPALRSPLAELDRLLGEQRVDGDDPVVLVVHLACPHLAYTDRGKSRLALPAEIAEALTSAIEAVTKGWKTAKRQADRDDRVRQRDLDELRKAQKRQQWTVKEAAYQVMADAYRKASAGGALPANARQIMYAARPLVLALTGGKGWKESSYFTQHLLPDYIAEYPDATAGWDVVFDARGHLAEPHTGQRVDLGTLAVRRYIAGWTDGITDDLSGLSLDPRISTSGPGNRYRYALFIEKEGFTELLAAARIAQRFDIAIMSTKGMSNTASRRVVEELSRQGVTILVLHDFDKAGFSILNTLRSDTRRYAFDHRPKVLDLGLRLADVQVLGLQSEPVEYDGNIDPKINLAECGATQAEQRYLVRRHLSGLGKQDKQGNWQSTGPWIGERVELNAMTSDQFIAWLEGKLAEHQVRKLVPDAEALAAAYRRAWRRAQVQEMLDQALAELPADEIPIPPDLQARISAEIAGTARPWDDAIYTLARSNWGLSREIQGT